jgi:hypothetical protein
MEDLFGILNVLDEDKFGDEEEFFDRFGKGMPNPEQVQDLQVRRLPLAHYYCIAKRISKNIEMVRAFSAAAGGAE